MKKILNREKNIDNYVKNVYLVTPSSKDDIIYKMIYLNFHQFELQILRKKELQYAPRFAFFQILDYITIAPTHKSTIENTFEIEHSNVNLIFQHKILKNIYELEWSIEDSAIKLKIHTKNGDKIKSPIKLLLLHKVKNEIKDVDIVNYSCSTVISTIFKLEKIPSVPDLSKQLIPKVIMQTHKYTVVKDEIYNSSISWLICNPDYKYEFYDDRRCVEFIKKYFPSEVLNAFHTLVPGAYKADLFRYCYLYICGGVYTDIDNICMCNLKNFILEDDTFVSVKDRPHGAIYNAFIASTPKNPIFKNAIDNILHNVKYRIYPLNITPAYNDKYLAITGPVCLGKSLNVFLKRELTNEFEEGNHNINNMKFKLFYLHHGGKYVTYNNKIVFYVKYDGYQTTSNYLSMFDSRMVYRNMNNKILDNKILDNKIIESNNETNDSHHSESDSENGLKGYV